MDNPTTPAKAEPSFAGATLKPGQWFEFGGVIIEMKWTNRHEARVVASKPAAEHNAAKP